MSKSMVMAIAVGAISTVVGLYAAKKLNLA